MSVPFIDLKRFESGFLKAWEDKLREMTANTAFIGGSEVENLEKTLREENRVSQAVSCANGTDALQLALRALGVGPGDWVLLPDNTFWATFEAIVNVGGIPCTVDINPVDLQMDFNIFRQAAEKIKPKAAILVHLYGWASADLQNFREYCREQKIPLLEDGAQCYGVKADGKSIYQDADISTISFYPAKVFGAAGDAGAVLTQDEELAFRVRTLSNHGRASHYEYGMCGWNSRMDSLQAAFLNLAHSHLEKRLESRRQFAKRYRLELARIGVRCVDSPPNIEENGYLNATIHKPEIRVRLIEHLKTKGIGHGIVYPGSISDQRGGQGLLGEKFGGAEARKLSQSIISLPLFPYMTDEEFDEVIGAVADICG